MKEIYYSAYGNDPEECFDDPIKVWDSYDLKKELDLQCIAQECAEDYYNNRDGWEAGDSFELWLFDSAKKYLGVFSIDVEYNASFGVTRFKDESE